MRRLPPIPLAAGEVRSDSRLFPVPALGASWKAGENGAFGLSVYGNGGMNTDWPTATFCAGSPAGANLDQMFLAPAYAYKLAGRHALGVTAIGALQWFRAEGVGSFAPFSSSPSNLRAPLGSDGGAGFGWKDVTTVKTGTERNETAFDGLGDGLEETDNG